MNDMKRHLNEVLENIAEEYGGNILDGSKHYLEVDIGKRAEVLGYPTLAEKYCQVNAWLIGDETGANNCSLLILLCMN